MINDFLMPGKMSFILGGQFGSEGKGAAAAYVAARLIDSGQMFDIVTTNAGVQSGHTSVHKGQKRVQFHLPTAAVVAYDAISRGELKSAKEPVVFLNAGAIIDPEILRQELDEFPRLRLYVHPNAAVITQDCKDAEGRVDSAQTKIASTRKGVGEALSRKVLRSGMVARDHPYLKQFVRRVELSTYMRNGASVLAEVPQGFSLGLNQRFYPHCTSRDCTVGQAMSDAQVHPAFYGSSMLVLRTFPIRVGNIMEYAGPYMGEGVPVEPIMERALGHSGGGYHDQLETSWNVLGVKPEITTVTKRVRRVFTWSHVQVVEAMTAARPEHVFLAFCDYMSYDERVKHVAEIQNIAISLGLPAPHIYTGYGPSTEEVEKHNG